LFLLRVHEAPCSAKNRVRNDIFSKYVLFKKAPKQKGGCLDTSWIRHWFPGLAISYAKNNIKKVLK